MALDHAQLDKLLALARRAGTPGERAAACSRFVGKLQAAGVETMSDLVRLLTIGTEPDAPISQKELQVAAAAKMRGDNTLAQDLARRAARMNR